MVGDWGHCCQGVWVARARSWPSRTVLRLAWHRCSGGAVDARAFDRRAHGGLPCRRRVGDAECGPCRADAERRQCGARIEIVPRLNGAAPYGIKGIRWADDPIGEVFRLGSGAWGLPRWRPSAGPGAVRHRAARRRVSPRFQRPRVHREAAAEGKGDNDIRNAECNEDSPGGAAGETCTGRSLEWTAKVDPTNSEPFPSRGLRSG